VAILWPSDPTTCWDRNRSKPLLRYGKEINGEKRIKIKIKKKKKENKKKKKEKQNKQKNKIRKIKTLLRERQCRAFRSPPLATKRPSLLGPPSLYYPDLGPFESIFLSLIVCFFFFFFELFTCREVS
jgi:hypothetical protein